MRDLIKELRDLAATEEVADRAADELERLQAHITAMTKDMDSLEQQLRMADLAIEQWKKAYEESRANDKTAMRYLNDVRSIVGGDDFPDMVKRVAALKRENEELRKEIAEWEAYVPYTTIGKLQAELAALKSQSTEQPVAWIYSYEDTHAVELKRYPDDELVEGCLITPLYQTPPTATATALVEDFKRRAVDLCHTINMGYERPFNAVIEVAEAIESLPPIGEK